MTIWKNQMVSIIITSTFSCLILFFLLFPQLRLGCFLNAILKNFSIPLKPPVDILSFIFLTLFHYMLGSDNKQRIPQVICFPSHRLPNLSADVISSTWKTQRLVAESFLNWFSKFNLNVLRCGNWCLLSYHYPRYL